MLTLENQSPRPQQSPPPLQTASPEELSQQGFWLGLGLTLILAAFLYVSLATNWPKFSRAEIFFAECAREMLAKSNLITPLYHGQPFFDKPILAYWLIVSSFKAFGVTHLVARIPSIVAALLTAAITAVCTSKLFGRRAGVLAAMMLTSSFMFFSFATLCMSDMLLVLFDTMALALLYFGVQDKELRTYAWWFAAMSMGLGFATKGPVGLVLPIVFFLTYLGITHQFHLIQRKHLIIGAATVIAVACPWFLAAWRSNGSGSMYYFFIHENLERFTGSTYDTHRPIGHMAVSLLTGFAPWSVFLPLALYTSIQKWRSNFKSPELQRELYLWLWIAVIVGFFSLSRGKIDYYVLPAYPAAAAISGLYLSRALAATSRPAIPLPHTPAHTISWLFSITLIIGGIASVYFLTPMVQGSGTAAWIMTPAALGLAGIMMFASMWQHEYFRAYTVAFTGLCLAVIGFSLQILPAITQLTPCIDYASIIRTSPKNTQIGMDKTLENWIDEVTFQTGREPQKLETTAQLTAFLSNPQPVLVMVPQDCFDKLPLELLTHLRIVDSRPSISHAINPGYIIQRKGHLADDLPLLLVSNSAFSSNK